MATPVVFGTASFRICSRFPSMSEIGILVVPATFPRGRLRLERAPAQSDRLFAYCCNRRSRFSLIARHLDNRSTGYQEPAKMCPFYRTTRVPAVERRRVPRDNGGAPPPVDAPWCAHLYTPVTRFAATAFAGGWRKLLCAGDLVRCEVNPSNRPRI